MNQNQINKLIKNIDNINIIFIDIEVDMLKKNLIQFAAVKSVNGETNLFNWYCKQHTSLSYYANLIINNNIKEKINNGYEEKELIQKIFDLTNNCIFISFGDLDINFLNDLSIKHLKKSLNVSFIDFQLEWKIINQNIEKISLVNLAKIFKIKVDEKELHNALFDVKLMYSIFKKWKMIGNNKVIEYIFEYNTNSNNFDLLFNKKKQAKYILFKIEKEIRNDVSNKKQLLIKKFSLISTEQNKIIENWEIDFANSEISYHNEIYLHNLIDCLRRFIYSSKGHIFYIFENQKKELFYLNQLCIDFFNHSLNPNFYIINGIEHYLNQLNKEEIQSDITNYDLIIIWKAIILIKSKIRLIRK
ncbi:MAG: hypothetical protein ACRCW6_01260 [Mycoplasmoidaceae bacterium]